MQKIKKVYEWHANDVRNTKHDGAWFQHDLGDDGLTKQALVWLDRLQAEILDSDVIRKNPHLERCLVQLEFQYEPENGWYFVRSAEFGAEFYQRPYRLILAIKSKDEFNVDWSSVSLCVQLHQDSRDSLNVATKKYSLWNTPLSQEHYGSPLLYTFSHILHNLSTGLLPVVRRHFDGIATTFGKFEAVDEKRDWHYCSQVSDVSIADVCEQILDL